MRRYQKPTIKDVAAQAGVSTTTVSVFVSGREEVCSPETAERIRAAITALRYTPNSLSRSLRLNATDTLGISVGTPSVLRQDPLNSFVERVWRGITDAADARDYSLLHYPTSVRNAESCDAFLDGRVDGILISSSHTDPRPATIAAAGMPIVVLTRSTSLPPDCGAVYANEADTVHLALSHLWEQGHRRIAHVAGPAGSNDIARNRLNEFIAWLQKRDAFDSRLVSADHNWGSDPTGAVAIWHSLPERPTAVLCANDALALKTIDAAQARGWRVPEDLSVIGVDNQTGDVPVPALTSVDIPAEEIGYEAVMALLNLIKGAPVEECRIMLPVTRLVIRSTTAPMHP